MGCFRDLNLLAGSLESPAFCEILVSAAECISDGLVEVCNDWYSCSASALLPNISAKSAWLHDNRSLKLFSRLRRAYIFFVVTPGSFLTKSQITGLNRSLLYSSI